MQRRSPTVTAHRGGAALGPENSLTALRRAMALGLDWAEIDVQLTADHAVVVVHDEDLTRLAGIGKRVNECTLAELREVKVGGRESIPTLDECIAVIRGRTRLMIEMKDYGRSEGLAARVVELLREKDFLGGARLCSFSPTLVHEARALDARVDVGYVSETAPDLPPAGEASFVSICHTAITASLVRAAHRRGLEVHAWTVNDRTQILRLLALGVDNVITDDPSLGKRALTEFARKGWLARQLLRRK